MTGVPLASARSMSGLSWFGVEEMDTSPLLAVSQAQPEPNRPSAALANSSLNLSNEPNFLSIAAARVPFGVPPPFGDRMFQKKVWFQWPPPLLRTATGCLLTF